MSNAIMEIVLMKMVVQEFARLSLAGLVRANSSVLFLGKAD
jgi:hypothetical protein